MAGPRHRSPAAAAASRRNGACGTGPRSTAGKANSSRNAVKHGLFRTQLSERSEVSAEMAGLSAILEDLAAGCYEAAIQIEMALLAQMRLEEATRLVGHLREELSLILVAGGGEQGRLDGLVEQIVRIARYQRRFRGQRDRALRTLLKVARTRAGQSGPITA